MRAPPYEVRRLGWGTFTIEAEIVLKESHSWIVDNSGLRQSGLELTWILDFEGRGRQGRVRAKVKKMEQHAAEVVAPDVGEGRRTRRTRQTGAVPSTVPVLDDDDDEEDDDNYAEADDNSEASEDEEDISEYIETPRR
jgi:hypothetical protein